MRTWNPDTTFIVLRNDLRNVALAGGGGSFVFAAADAVSDTLDCCGVDEGPDSGGRENAVRRVFGPRRVEDSLRGTSSEVAKVGSVN